jgi:hypothetical protein
MGLAGNSFSADLGAARFRPASTGALSEVRAETFRTRDRSLAVVAAEVGIADRRTRIGIRYGHRQRLCYGYRQRLRYG